MHIICDKNIIHKEVAFAQEIISSHAAISILSNIYLEASNGTLNIKVTDMKVYFETTIPVNIIEPGSITVYCEKFFSILNSVPEGELDIEVVNNKVVIKIHEKKIRFQLKSIASEKFPEFPSIKENITEVSFLIADLKEMITQTAFAVSDDETRYFMNGVFFEKDEATVNMVATDGRRLAIISKIIDNNINSFNGIIIPTKILFLIQKRFGNEGIVDLEISDKYIAFSCGTYKLTSVLIDGQFPNYRRVIPETQSYSLLIGTKDLLDAIKRVSLFVEQKTKRIYLNVSDEIILVTSEESDIGDAVEEIPCEYSGQDIRIALNYKYLEEPLKVIGVDKIKIAFTEANKAISIFPFIEKGFFHIIMPMQTE